MGRKELGDFLSANHMGYFVTAKIPTMTFGYIDKGRTGRVKEVTNLFCKVLSSRFNIQREE